MINSSYFGFWLKCPRTFPKTTTILQHAAEVFMHVFILLPSILKEICTQWARFNKINFYCFIKNILKWNKNFFFFFRALKRKKINTNVLTSLNITALILSIPASAQSSHKWYFSFDVASPWKTQGYLRVDGTHFKKHSVRLFKPNKYHFKPSKMSFNWLKIYF